MRRRHRRGSRREFTVGAAPGCRLLPIKWESPRPLRCFIADSKLLAALDFMADKVDIVSNSWGSSPRRASWHDRRQPHPRTGRDRRPARPRDRIPVGGGERELPDPARRGRWTCRSRAAGTRTARWIGVETARVFRTQSRRTFPASMHVAALASNAQRSHYSNYGTRHRHLRPVAATSHEYRRRDVVTGLGITTAIGGTMQRQYRSAFGGHVERDAARGRHRGARDLRQPGADRAGGDRRCLKRTASKDLDFQDLSANAARKLRSRHVLGRIADRPVRQGALHHYRRSRRHVEPVVRSWPRGRGGGGGCGASASVRPPAGPAPVELARSGHSRQRGDGSEDRSRSPRREASPPSVTVTSHTASSETSGSG